LSDVPLLDMLNYHRLLAGSSWMDEYGNPDDPDMREVIRQYSPYHNLSKDKSYPEVFFMTSTADDRVHPYHARAMVAKMEYLGHPVLYYEDTSGGHGGAVDINRLALMIALRYTYLYYKLASINENIQ